MKLVLLGYPGSGKGTQAEKISETYDIPKYSTGDILRKEIESGSTLGNSVKQIMSRGDYVTDDTVNNIVENYISDEGFILDGFPRNLYQAQFLDDLLSSKSIALDFVIFLSIDEQKVVSRLGGRYSCSDCGALYHNVTNKTAVDGVCDNCGSKDFIIRDDDQPNAILHRLEVYKKNTLPLVEYIRKKVC